MPHILRRLHWLRYRLFAWGLARLPRPIRWGYYRRVLSGPPTPPPVHILGQDAGSPASGGAVGWHRPKDTL